MESLSSLLAWHSGIMSSKASGLSLDMPGCLYCSVPSRDLHSCLYTLLTKAPTSSAELSSIPNLPFELTAFWNSVLGVLPPLVLRLLPCNQSAMLYLSHAVRAMPQWHSETWAHPGLGVSIRKTVKHHSILAICNDVVSLRSFNPHVWRLILVKTCTACAHVWRSHGSELLPI